MAKQKLKSRDKKVQKMTRDGLVEVNKSSRTEERVSSRASDTKLYRNRNPDSNELVSNSDGIKKRKNYSERRLEARDGKLGISKEAAGRQRSSRQDVLKNDQTEGSTEEGAVRLLEEKTAELFESRGDSRKKDTGGTKRPQQKKRLQFASEETGASEQEKNKILPG